MTEFIATFCEYNLMPIAIFLVGYFKIKRDNDQHRGFENGHNLKGSGFDYVIIEFFTTLAVCLRIGLDENVAHKTELVTALFYLEIAVGIVLAFVGLITLMNIIVTKGTIHYMELTFYVSFISWVIRILLLICYSRLLHDLSIGSILILLTLPSVLILLFVKIFRWNIVASATHLAIANAYYHQQKYQKSLKLGMRVLKHARHRDGEHHDYYKKSLLLCAGLLVKMEKVPQKKWAKVRLYLEDFISNPVRVLQDLNMYVLLLVAMYTKEGEYDLAAEYFEKNYVDGIDKNQYINLLMEKDNRNCTKIYKG